MSEAKDFGKEWHELVVLFRESLEMSLGGFRLFYLPSPHPPLEARGEETSLF